MIPTRDDLERRRAPLLAGALALAALAAAIALLLAGEGAAAAGLALAGAAAIWIFGAGVEGGLGRPWTAALALSGGFGGAALTVAFGDEGRWAAGAAAGAALELVAAHLLRFPGARVTSVLVAPLASGVHEAPAWVWGLAWAALSLALIALGALG